MNGFEPNAHCEGTRNRFHKIPTPSGRTPQKKLNGIAKEDVRQQAAKPVQSIPRSGMATSDMLLVSTTRIIPRRAVPSLPSGRYSAVKVRKKLYVAALRSYGCVLHSWRAGLAREQFAGGRGGARTNRERARLDANESRTGAAGRGGPKTTL